MLQSSILSLHPFHFRKSRSKGACFPSPRYAFIHPPCCGLSLFPPLPFVLSISSVCFSRPSYLRVHPSPQQFIIITSPQCDGTHLRLIMCQTHTHTHAQALANTHRGVIHLSLITCLTVLLTWEIIEGAVCNGRGQTVQVGRTDAHTHTFKLNLKRPYVI